MKTESELLDLAWTYPLFEALYGRRSRRFGLGFEMPEGPFRYKSAHRPVPLSELEEALLVGAGAGFSGLAFWDLPTPPLYRGGGRRGRTFPTTRPGGHTALFFTNDEGFYVLDANVAASKLREIETPDERGKLLEAYRAQRRHRAAMKLGPYRTASQRASIARARSRSARKDSPAPRRFATTSTTLTADFPAALMRCTSCG